MYYLVRFLKKLRLPAVKNSKVDYRSKIEGDSQFINSSMGKYSFCGYSCTILNTSIGSFCSIASNVKIGLAKHPIEWGSTSPAFYFGRDSISKRLAKVKYDPNVKKTIIGNDVWIGENVCIKQGVRIGNGSIIGMGSIVTKNIGDYEIWAGNPAKFIRKRFNDDLIDLLTDSNWWNLPDESLKKISNSISNPKEFAGKATVYLKRNNT